MLIVEAGSLSLTLPGNWSDMSLGQFTAYAAAQTDEEIIAALSGVSLGELQTQPLVDYRSALGLLTYLQTIPDFRAIPCPRWLELPDRRVDLKRIGESLLFGQSIDLKAAVKQRSEQSLPTDYASMAIDLLVISLYERVTGEGYPAEADPGRVYSIAELLSQAPLMQAMPLAAYLRSYYDNPPVPKHMVYLPLKGKTATRRESIKLKLMWLRTYLPFYKPKRLING